MRRGATATVEAGDAVPGNPLVRAAPTRADAALGPPVRTALTGE